MPITDGARCQATAKSTHEQCTQPAIAGTAVCRLHGGSTKANREAGKRRLAKRAALAEAAEMARPLQVEPLDALLYSLYTAYGMLRYWQSEIEQLVDDEGLVATSSSKMYGDSEYAREAAVQHRHWTTELARVSKLCLDAGINERRVRLAEAEADLIVQFVRGFCKELQIDIAEPRVIAAYTKHLQLVAGATENVA